LQVGAAASSPAPFKGRALDRLRVSCTYGARENERGQGMSYQVNSLVRGVAPPPIAEAHGWVRGRSFPADKPLLDMAQAVPSYPPAEALQAHVAEIARRPETSNYTPILGLPHLREKLARRMSANYDAAIAADRVAIAAGCNQAFCLAMTALAGPGDEVLLPAPYYFNYQMWLEMQAVRPVHLACPEARGAMPDPAEAARLIGPRTRAIVLVTPNNPTGAIYPPELIAAFYDLAKAKGVALVLDETYRDFRLEATAPHDLFRRADWDGTLIQLYSFSKVYALTGYRIGSLIAGTGFLEEVAKIADCVAICAPRIGQEAAAFGLDHLADWQREKCGAIGERLEALRRIFTDNRLKYGLVSSGAYFAYVRHPFDGEPAAQVARRLADEQNILCLPGTMFGPGQEAYLRLAFANLDKSAMPEVLRRLLASQP
jgi:aspartate/methionine/tyrosine aminotransferase